MDRRNHVKTVKPDLKSGFINESGKNMLFAVVIGVIAGSILLNENLVTNVVFYAFVIAVTGFAALEARSYFILKNTEYRFYEKEIEFYEGWLSITQKNVAYDRVTDISYDKPLNQRTFGTGNVNINTAGTNTHKIKIRYIKQPEENYNELRDIIWKEK